MTSPRQVLPGTSYLVTRRCSQRQYLLRPSREATELFGYLLAVAAARFRVEIHAYCVMSNHAHLVVSDPEAHLPAFSQYLDSLVARAMNRLLGRRENFWAPSSYSAVALQQSEDLVDKVAYVLANPVEAGLVRHGRKWPGLWSAPSHMGTTAQDFKRPERFFRRKGRTALPAVASLDLTIPRGFESAAAFRRDVGRALYAREVALAKALSETGRGFLGVERVLAQRPSGRPAGEEPRGRINPRVACRDKWRRIQALARLVDFLREYRRAFVQWRAGATRVEFPAGTYLMRVLHGASCAAPG